MDDKDSGVKGIRGGRPPMLGSTRLGPRTPVPKPAPFLSPGPFQGGNAAQRTRPADTSRGAKEPVVAPPSGAKKRVLFVCIGNSCRSQMAEAFARAYGANAIIASSAGVSPASIIAPLTRQVLIEKNIPIGDQYPKGLEMALREPFDVVVNMSGLPLAMGAKRVVDWRVQDPIGHNEGVYRKVAAQIEEMVMRLILELRAPAK
jgi:arsenate reductase (thioredoxin)